MERRRVDGGDGRRHRSNAMEAVGVTVRLTTYQKVFKPDLAYRSDSICDQSRGLPLADAQDYRRPQYTERAGQWLGGFAVRPQ